MSNRLLLYLLAFIEGGVVMMIELAGARMIAPTYGTSFMVWAVVLAAAVGALALGYYAGGRMAERYRSSSFLMSLFICAAIVVMLMPAAALLLVRIPITYFNFSLAAYACVLLVPPVFLLGSTTPFITGLLAKDNNAGSEAGKIFGISTLGGIVATFTAGFYIIPAAGLTNTVLYSSLLLALIPCIFLLVKKKFFLPVLFIALAVLSARQNAKPDAIKDVEVLHYSEGLLGQLVVADFPKSFQPGKGYDRVLFVNRTGQTWVDRDSKASVWDYVPVVIHVAGRYEKPEILLLGLGGGTVARELERELGAKVDAVELDERIASLAKQYFDLGEGTNIIIDDARHYIRTCKKKYDLIIFDVFKGEVPPAHALTLEAFEEAKQLLNKNGKVVINFNGFISGKEGMAGRSVLKTLEAAGFATLMHPTPGEENFRNILFVADPFAPSFPSAANHGEALVLTDDLPVLDQLNLPAAQSWRKMYTSTWTKIFTGRGVPVFE